jgi:hypothetical protein
MRTDGQDKARDLIDEAMEIPVVGPGLTRLQRVLAPSCFASLVILLLLIAFFGRWIHLPPIGLAMVLVVVWLLTLAVLVRVRNPDPDGERASFEVIDRKK